MSETAQLPFSGFSEPELDAFVQATLEEFPAPGLVVTVVNRNETWTRCYGHANLSTKQDVTPRTLFPINSITKCFTASVCAGLVESPAHPSVSWKSPLTSLIPGLALAENTELGAWATKHATLEDALGHRLGMARHDMARANGDPPVPDLVHSMRYLPFKHELRTTYSYDNIAYAAGVRVAELAAERDFDSLLRTEIFEPLAMRDTVYSDEDAKSLAAAHEDLQVATRYQWKNESFESVSPDKIAPSQGQGGIVSTALDLAKWMRHLLFPADLTPATSKKAVEALQAPKMLKKPEVVEPFFGTHTYGLGLDLAMYRGRRIAWHGGSGAGSQSMMLLALPTTKAGSSFNEDGWGVMVMLNSQSQARSVIAWHMLDAYLNVPEAERRNMAGAARKAKNSKRPVDANKDAVSNNHSSERDMPGQPLSAYEGLYRHPAYHGLTVSQAPPPGRAAIATLTDSQVGAPTLYLAPETKTAASGQCVRLERVSGEDWRLAPVKDASNFLVQAAKRVEFILGEGGELQGLRAVAESTMPDALAFFQRV